MKKLIATLCLSVLLLPFAACTVEKTDNGEMPNVDVNAEAGELPEYDVDAANVEVGTETKEIEVPDIDIEPPNENNDNDVDEPPAY